MDRYERTTNQFSIKIQFGLIGMFPVSFWVYRPILDVVHNQEQFGLLGVIDHFMQLYYVWVIL